MNRISEDVSKVRMRWSSSDVYDHFHRFIIVIVYVQCFPANCHTLLPLPLLSYGILN
jgi:hypothetical protein